MKNTNIDLHSLINGARVVLRRIARYKAFLFFLAIALLYGFIVWRINVLSNVDTGQPDSLVSSSQTTTQPHIDPSVVQKIQNLQDNSVSVQSLFDQARQNPFQE